MQIDFNKIKSLIDINYSKNDTTIVGTLERVNRSCVKLNATFHSTVTVTCNRCGKEFSKPFDYDLSLLISDGAYKERDEIDIIEFFKGKVDFDYIAQSEISSIQEDYNYCSDCVNSDEILEIEF
jgi:hypothetical protein